MAICEFHFRRNHDCNAARAGDCNLDPNRSRAKMELYGYGGYAENPRFVLTPLHEASTLGDNSDNDWALNATTVFTGDDGSPRRSRPRNAPKRQPIFLDRMAKRFRPQKFLAWSESSSLEIAVQASSCAPNSEHPPFPTTSLPCWTTFPAASAWALTALRGRVCTQGPLCQSPRPRFSQLARK